MVYIKISLFMIMFNLSNLIKQENYFKKKEIKKLTLSKNNK